MFFNWIILFLRTIKLLCSFIFAEAIQITKSSTNINTAKLKLAGNENAAKFEAC